MPIRHGGPWACVKYVSRSHAPAWERQQLLLVWQFNCYPNETNATDQPSLGARRGFMERK